MPPHKVTVTYTLTQVFTVPTNEYEIASVNLNQIIIGDGRIVCADATHVSRPMVIKGQRTHTRFV